MWKLLNMKNYQKFLDKERHLIVPRVQMTDIVNEKIFFREITQEGYGWREREIYF